MPVCECNGEGLSRCPVHGPPARPPPAFDRYAQAESEAADLMRAYLADRDSTPTARSIRLAACGSPPTLAQVAAAVRRAAEAEARLHAKAFRALQRGARRTEA